MHSTPLPYFLLFLLFCSLPTTAQSFVGLSDSTHTTSISGYSTQLDQHFFQQQHFQHLPIRNIQDLTLLTPTGYFPQNGLAYWYGVPLSDNNLWIDGIQISDARHFPFRSIGRMGILANQSPIQLGNSLAGFTIVETAAIGDQLSIQAEVLSASPFHNSLGEHIVELNASGPIRLGKKGKFTPKFHLAGTYKTTNDANPSSAGSFRLKEEVLQQVENAPLLEVSNGFLQQTSFITAEDWESNPFKENAGYEVFSAFGKVELPLSKNLGITIGNFTSIEKSRPYVHSFALFNSARQPEQLSRSSHTYARLRADLIKSDRLNIDYQMQFNFSNDFAKTQDPLHQDRFFNYGYVGQFQSDSQPLYGAGQVGQLFGQTLLGYVNTAITYTPYEGYTGTFNETDAVNPIWAQHNLQYFANESIQNNTYSDVTGRGGLINGFIPASLSSSYSLWHSAGTPYHVYAEASEKRQQIQALFNISLPNHHWKFGYSYQQEHHQNYQLRPQNLWSIMGTQVATFGQGIVRDIENPILIIDGQSIPLSDYDGGINHPVFGENDTITYNLIRDEPISFFEQNLREGLGLNADQFINIHSLSPDDVRLDMFSPDELFSYSQENPILSYAGYDYLGNRLKRNNQASFEAFWTDFDEEKGIFNRPIAAYQPISTSIFAEYQFKLKFLTFTAGLRVDRFDANQTVPKDKWSPLYGIRTAGDISQIQGQMVNHPSTIGDDFVVYVDNEVDPTHITGYRDGDQWYDKDGQAIFDPILIDASGQLNPYLAAPLSAHPEGDVKSEDYSLVYNLAFADYKPVINLLPQASLTANLTKTTQLFGSYTTLTENPSPIFNQANPFNYYYFNERLGKVLTNPNLKPMRISKVHAGLRQHLYKDLYGQLSYFWNKAKNNISVIRLPFAYPAPYLTYGHIGSTTVHGGNATLSYKHPQQAGLHFAAHYTLQFSDGTASINPLFSSTLILNPFVRHNLNSYLQFNFGLGQHYLGPKTKAFQHLLEGLSIGLQGNYRSGTAFSRQVNPTPEAQFSHGLRPSLAGPVNGSRKPSFQQFHLKIEKQFPISPQLQLGAYIWVNNLFNWQNVWNVYRFSGEADDDGYLTSQFGQDNITTQANETAFVDQYRLKVNNPANFGQPRLVRIGAVLRFR